MKTDSIVVIVEELTVGVPIVGHATLATTARKISQIKVIKKQGVQRVYILDEYKGVTFRV